MWITELTPNIISEWQEIAKKMKATHIIIAQEMKYYTFRPVYVMPHDDKDEMALHIKNELMHNIEDVIGMGEDQLLRISLEDTDRGYNRSTYRSDTTAFLNGKEVKHCVTADEEMGFCRVHVYKDGKRLIHKGELVTKIIYGKVEIVFKARKYNIYEMKWLCRTMWN